MDNTDILRRISILLAVGSTLLVSACAQQRDPRTFKAPIEEVHEYYDRFYDYYGVDPYYVSAGFVEEIEGNTVAICKSWSSGHREIWIESSYWDELGDYGREQLVFHELGHCVFSLDHSNNEYSDGCPESIMNEYTFGDTWCYADYHEDLIDELGGM